MKAYLTAILWVFVVYFSQAQKIKYKDVFPMLNPQQSEEGVRLLRLFLQEEKNQDEANANYQLAEHFYLTYKSIDILQDTASMFAYGDSATVYYQKTLPLITEKELKKNDNYYQSFYRRDLRTGEFGIKLSDVKLDLENKIKEIENRNDQVAKLHQILESMKLTHKAIVDSYNGIVDQFSSYEAYLFQLDQQQLQQIGALTEYQYQMNEKSEQLKALFKEIAAPDPFSELELKKMPVFSHVESIFAPYVKKYQSWNAEDWVDDVSNVFRSDIQLYKSGLLRWDKSLNLVKERIGEGLPATISTVPSENLRSLQTKYDKNAAMVSYLELKANVLLVESLTDTQLYPQWLDSSNVQLNVDLADSVVKLIEWIEPKFDGIDSKIKSEARIYEDHIDELYGGVSAITSSLSAWKKKLGRLQSEWLQHQANWRDKNSWVDWKDQVISIDTTLMVDTTAFVTLSRYDQGTDVNVLVMQRQDSSMHLLQTGPDRVARWFTNLDLTYDVNQDFKWLPAQSGFASLLVTEQLDSVMQATAVKVSKEGEVQWKSELQNVIKVHHVSWDEIIDQYTIYFYEEDKYPLADGSKGYIIVDKDGKIK